MNVRNSTFLAMMALALIFTPGLAAAQQPRPKVTFSASRAQMVEAPDEVVLGKLPQMSAADAAVLSQVTPPARRTPFSPQQYQAMKAEAASKPRSSQPSGSSAQIETPSPPSSPTPPGISTPSATGFSGLGFGCGLAYPPDMALAVSQQFVLQVINGCIAVWDKAGVLQTGFPRPQTLFLVSYRSRYRDRAPALSLTIKFSIRERSTIG